MNKKDCELGMFVGVIQNVTALAKGRIKVKRIGKIVGIYDDFVNLLLFDCDFSDLENITLGKEMYRETFRFQEIFNIENLKIENLKIEKE